MPLTRGFKETLQARVRADPAFRLALLEEAVGCLVAGDVDTGRALLRDYVNATSGFAALSTATGIPAKSLMRMLGPDGNPQAKNLLGLIAALQREAGVQLEVRAEKESEPAA